MSFGKMSVGQMPFGNMPVGQMSVSQMSVCQRCCGQMSVSQTSLCQMSIGQTPVEQMSFGQTSACKRCVGKIPIGQMSVGQKYFQQMSIQKWCWPNVCRPNVFQRKEVEPSLKIIDIINSIKLPVSNSIIYIYYSKHLCSIYLFSSILNQQEL